MSLSLTYRLWGVRGGFAGGEVGFRAELSEPFILQSLLVGSLSRSRGRGAGDGGLVGWRGLKEWALSLLATGPLTYFVRILSTNLELTRSGTSSCDRLVFLARWSKKLAQLLEGRWRFAYLCPFVSLFALARSSRLALARRRVPLVPR